MRPLLFARDINMTLEVYYTIISGFYTSLRLAVIPNVGEWATLQDLAMSVT